MDNRRRYQRYPFYEPVSFQQKHLETPLEGSLSEDISLQGLKLNVNEFIPLNTVLELQIQIPGQVRMVFVNAKVVWVKESPKRIDGWQVGLELVDDKSSLSEIENYVRFLRFERA